VWAGYGSDTGDLTPAINNVTVCYASDSAHAMEFGGECENSAPYAGNSTCPGSPQQSCTAAFEVSSDTTGHGWNTIFKHAYAYLVGNVYQYDNANGAFNSKITWDRTLSGQYTQHYYFYGSTACPANASGIKVGVDNYDCNHALVAATVN
jgi:hypothetical protein